MLCFMNYCKAIKNSEESMESKTVEYKLLFEKSSLKFSQLQNSSRRIISLREVTNIQDKDKNITLIRNFIYILVNKIFLGKLNDACALSSSRRVCM